MMFWFRRDWGMYGRAYEKIAVHLAARPEIGRVTCILPPRKLKRDELAWPLSFSHMSSKLCALSQNTGFLATDLAPSRLRKWVNTALPDLSLTWFLRMLGCRKENTVLWLYPPHPHIRNLQELVPHASLIVHIVDNSAHIESRSEQYRATARAQYDSLVAQADCVIVSSEANYSLFSNLNHNCHLVENALDKAFLKQSSDLPYRRNGGRARLGYVGWLTERTDTDLLGHLADIRPQYDLILAGPLDSANISPLLARPNVTWLGARRYEDVPELVRSFDVCLIPHRDTPYSRSMSPLKLFQYLGSGRPIVSTPVAGTQRWQGHVYIAHNYDDFVAKVDEALENETVETAQARIAAVSSETWETRIEQLIKIVTREAGCAQQRQLHFLGRG